MAVIKLKYSIKKLENPIAQVTPKITVMIAKSGDTHIRNDKTNKIKIPINAKIEIVQESEVIASYSSLPNTRLPVRPAVTPYCMLASLTILSIPLILF